MSADFFQNTTGIYSLLQESVQLKSFCKPSTSWVYKHQALLLKLVFKKLKIYCYSRPLVVPLAEAFFTTPKKVFFIVIAFQLEVEVNFSANELAKYTKIINKISHRFA